MNTNFFHGSAKIYEFPAGGRASFGGHREGAGSAAEITSIGLGRVSKTVFGSGWYHEAAVEEAEQARNS
jgi:hypothetical protein